MTVKSKRTRCEFLGKPGAYVKVEGNYVINNINVQSGCTVYFTPDGGMPEAQQQAAPPATLPKDVPLWRIEQAFLAGIRAVLNAGLIQYKQDFRAIHQMIVEMRYHDKFSLPDLLDLLKKVGGIPNHLMPSLSNLKCITFKKTHYPNWVVNGFGPSETQHLVSIGEAFKLYFEKNLSGH